MGYQTLYDRSMQDPSAFWAEAAALIDWTAPGTRYWMIPIRPSTAGSRVADSIPVTTPSTVM